ncbi:MAG: anaerobic carbon-monoxide dehydrogenase catalytic subunit [Lachnospiraceae bacterium]|nr:anaerobic carbon-monoxide dehydrogenase catalytic subunit [Lachnospiraceae bacterium]MBR3361110.1 anaerobic carbon-monoxide dehydrogenase catalytic subunit [Lachnospiraceae bacterium]MBR6357582.1 anaerobic carbon-monoxide dehydrogenase catalytic subunit [Lachnospiraceae bacterium]MBR7075609.1 anaerobic carbon-monoxide dehydrogenase catalytic subunit [Lachnospiraceae bacterium]
MSWEGVIPSEEVIAATEELLKTAEKVGADTWQQRVRNQTPHCGFGESGTCCRICSMGPCRISKKAPRGICGCDVHGIVARNYLRFTAGGAATHSDHGRSIAHTLYKSSPDSDYKVKDEEKLLRIAKEWEIETEGRDIYDVAHDVALAGLNEYGKPFGTQRFLKRAPLLRQQIWESQDISPRAIDREVSQSMHMTHMGCSSDPEALVRQALRAGLSDGWGGSMMGTEFSDILFGTPKPIDTEANIGVMEEDMVNIIVHGHDPSLSEMIVFYANDPEMIALAKEQGAKGINIAGVCCTSNEVAMRHGIPMAGNFLAQENVVLTGACEAIVVDVQCIFPALGPLSKCFHTKFITTSHIAKIPDSEFIEFDEANAGENAKKIIRLAIMNFKNRDPELVNIPKQKSKATVGYSVEAIKKCLDGVTNSHVDELGTMKPLVDAVKSGVIRGAVAMVGCNNPKIRPDSFHVDLMKRLLENDILVVVSGCSAQAAAKVGLMDKEAAKYCGEGLKRVCRLVDIPPVLHMGSCVDISRMMVLASDIAKDWGIEISEIPLVGCAPEWMSEKAVSIGNYVVATGIDTFLGVDPYTKGSDQVRGFLQSGIKDWVGANFIVNNDIDMLTTMMIEHIEEKREALGI